MTLTTQLGDILNCFFNSGGSSFLCPMWDKIVDFLVKSVVMDNIVFRSIQGALFTGIIMLRPTRAGEPLTVSIEDVENVSFTIKNIRGEVAGECLQGDSHFARRFSLCKEILTLQGNSH